MFLNKINILYIFLIIINGVDKIQSLVELPIVEDNYIGIAETSIRNTLNKLFEAFNIDKVKHSPRLKRYSAIHNYFISITLQDCDNLKEIARLARVNNIDNDTQHFIAQINEVLNEDDKSNEVDTNNVYVTRYINTFIRKLKYLKDIYVTNNNTVINAIVLKYLRNGVSSLSEVNNSRINDTTVPNEKQFNDKEFWKPNSRRIYNGIRTNITMFPFIASIKFFQKFQCAGSIIGNDLIITSASCLQLAWNNRYFRENPGFLSVQIGSDKYEGDGEDIPVLAITFHPSYDPRTLSNNLAIIRLTRRISFGHAKQKVKKIDFDRSATPLAINPSKVIVIGWGAKDQSNIISNVFNNLLSYAELDFYPLRECQEHYLGEFVTRKNFCAGYYSVGSGACNRDAGGPGVIEGTLMGVVSFGSPICGAPDSPTVFTKLGYYTDWIETELEKSPLQTVAKTTEMYVKPKPVTSFRHTTQATFSLIPPMRPTSSIIKVSTSGYIHALRTEDKQFKDFLSNLFTSQELEDSINEGSLEVTTDGRETTPEKEDILEIYKSESMLESESVDTNEEKRTTAAADNFVPEKGVKADKQRIRAEKILDDSSTNNKDERQLESHIISFIDNIDLNDIVAPALKQFGLSEQNKISGMSKEENTFSDNVNSVKFKLQSSTETQNDTEGGISISSEILESLILRGKGNMTDKLISASWFAGLIANAIDEKSKNLKEKRYIL